MADIDLTQAEADSLIAMEKHRVSDDILDFPGPGQRLIVSLQSPDRRESFFLDVARSTVKLTKGTFQHRTRQVIILLRLDIDGAPHRNPDGAEIPCPHLHIYREGYGDKWAVAAPLDLVPTNGVLYSVLAHFMGRCNITQQPVVQEGLF
jgi:hypothetical protein